MEPGCRRSTTQATPLAFFQGTTGDANESVDIVIASGLDHVRNSIVAHADAVIAIGGGTADARDLLRLDLQAAGHRYACRWLERSHGRREGR